MKIRTTENSHEFTKKLFASMNIFSAENITMDANRNFTAVIESVQFDSGENKSISNPFTQAEIDAKLLLATTVGVPFYYVTYQDDVFEINEVKSFALQNKLLSLDATHFARWWAHVKGTTQTHPLNNGANLRTARTIFDGVIEATGQQWGGNVDGFIVDNGRITAIIDNISIAYCAINNTGADPSLFFHKKGPKYETWYSTVKLAESLQVPHLLMTFDKNNPTAEIVGMTAIDYLSTSGIYYVNNSKPYQTVVTGLVNIKLSVSNLVSSSTHPKII